MYSGGKLYRLIGDNFYNMIHDSLEDLGWFNPARKHLPVYLVPEPVDDNEVIQLNTIAVSDEEITTSDVELGSVLAEHRYRDWETDRKSTRLNSSHRSLSRMPSSA